MLEAIGERPRAGDRRRPIAEEPRHRGGRLEAALGIPAQSPPGVLEGVVLWRMHVSTS